MKHLTKTFKTLLTLIALTTIFAFTSCSEDNYHTDIINVDITGPNVDSMYNVIINLHNSKIKLTKSGDEASAVGKYANVYDVKFIFFNENNIVIDEYYTDIFDNITTNSRSKDFKVPGKTRKIIAYCNTDRSPERIVNYSTIGMSFEQINSFTYFLPEQEDPINSVGVYGIADNIDVKSNGIINIIVEPVVARIEISSVKINTTNISGVSPQMITTRGLYIHNIYENVNISTNEYSNFISIDNSSLFPKNMLGALDNPNADHRFCSLLNCYLRPEFISNNIILNPTKEVYGFQVLPTSNSVPNILIEIEAVYPNSETGINGSLNVIYKYINVNNYKVLDNNGTNYISLNQFERGKVYKMAIEIDFDSLSTEPGVNDDIVSSTIKITEWDEVNVTPVF